MKLQTATTFLCYYFHLYLHLITLIPQSECRGNNNVNHVDTTAFVIIHQHRHDSGGGCGHGGSGRDHVLCTDTTALTTTFGLVNNAGGCCVDGVGGVSDTTPRSRNGLAMRKQTKLSLSSTGVPFFVDQETEQNEQQQQQQQRGEVTLEQKEQQNHEMQPQKSSSKRQRHEMFQNTNAVSKSMPVPHPDLWRKCLDPDIHQYNDTEQSFSSPSSFWDIAKKILPKPQQQQKHNHGHISRTANTQQQALIKDVLVKFHDPKQGARDLLEQCQVITPTSSSTSSSSTNDGNYKNKEDNRLEHPEIRMQEQETLDHLTAVLSHFQNVASSYSATPSSSKHNPLSQPSSMPQCQARIVSTRGPIGTKCPRWHADHVPVRLVMSFLGPGCEYIPHETEVLLLDTTSNKEQQQQHRHEEPRREERVERGMRVVNRSALNHLEEEDTSLANDLIVPPESLALVERELQSLLQHGGGGDKDGDDVSVIRHAKEGDAVLLMGRGWEDRMDNHNGDNDHGNYSGDDDGGNVLASVHRSPTLMPGKERILLTVDLVDWDY